MPMIQWNDRLSVNVKEIDDQHNKLVALVNELHDAMVASKGRDVLGKIFGELITYTKSHFGTEEKYFEKFKYPQAAEHKKHHVELTKKALDLQTQFAAGKLTISMEVLNFLKDWLSNHIMKTDMAYKDHFNKNGLT